MRLVPLKTVARINEQVLPESTDPNHEFRYLDIGSVGTGRLVVDPQIMTFDDAPSRARRCVRPGDTLVSTVRTYLRAVWSAREGETGLVASTGFAVLTPRDDLDARYLGWYAQSSGFIEEIVSRSTGVSYPAINPGEIGALRIALPTMERQRAIADYLDAETARIDALIEKKERMVAEIREWIGRSPLGGQNSIGLEPVRRLLAKQERWTTSSGEMITAFRDGEVTTRTARGREGFTNSWVDEVRVQIVEEGDVVIHGLDGFSGAIGDSQNHGVCSPVYHVCTAPEGDTAFVGRLLRVLAVNGYLGGFATSTRERAVDFRNWDLFGRIPIPMVPAAVQMRLGDAIRSVRPLRKKINASESLANERRQALITAAVTGELEIKGAAV